MTTNDLCWLAGLLEGEGSFMHGPPSSPNCPVISIQMADEDIIIRVASLVGKKYSTIKLPAKGIERNWSQTFACRIRGKTAIDLMQQLQPLMGNRRKAKIEAIISSLRPSYRKLSAEDRLTIYNQYNNMHLPKKLLAKQWNISYSYCCRLTK